MVFKSASNLDIVSCNVNGLGDCKKRGGLFTYMKIYNPDILTLIDTRFDLNSEKNIRNETDYRGLFSSFSSNSRGIAILFKKSFIGKYSLIEADPSGNFLLVKCEYDGKTFLLCAVYGPNNDNPTFFDELFDKISNINLETILCGDFNTTLNFSLDNTNYIGQGNVRSRSSINHHISTLSIDDIYRVREGGKRSYTWFNKSGQQQARLDFFLTSTSLRPFITNCEHLTPYKSDHLPIRLSLDFSKFKKGKGLWKLNNSLLNNINYIERINRTIATTFAKYVLIDGYDDFFTESSELELENFLNLSSDEKNEFNYKINPNLLIEMLINDIKNESVSFESALKRELNEWESELKTRIAWLKILYGQQSNQNQNEVRARLREAENDLNDFIDLKTNTLYKARLSKFATEGEKPSNFFCSLEKNFSAQKYISKLLVGENNIEISNQEAIENEVVKFYEELYADKENNLTIPTISDFFDNDTINCSTLSQEDKLLIERDLHMDEIYEALKKTKNGGAPGFTGLTFEFYKVFWGKLKHAILACFNYSFEINRLPGSLTKGVISLLPKGDKPRNKIENYRPITLLDSLYKILSKVIASRINIVLPKIIHNDQNGFVKGRFIGECIRTTADVMQIAMNKKITGILLMVDYQKAFDSIAFKHIINSLQFFNFGENCIRWIKLLLYNFSACINHAGNLSKFFNILQGCRQGDPIASLIFVIAIEIFCIKLRSSKTIKSYKINDIDILLSLYADDITIFLQYDSASLYEVINIIKKFSLLSGLRIHMGKSQCVKIGFEPWKKDDLCLDLGLLWKQEFKLLGISFNANTLCYRSCIESKLKEIDACIGDWKNRFMTPLGRACISNTLLLSKINHLAFSIPSLSKHTIKTIENKIYSFIWGGQDKVARRDAKLPWIQGGLNLPDIKSSWAGFKFSWFRRLFNSNGKWTKILFSTINEHLPGLNRNNFWEYIGSPVFNRAINKMGIPFWAECIKTIKPLMLEYLKNIPEDLVHCYIWGNIIQKRNLPINKNDFPSLSFIKCAADLLENTQRGGADFKSYEHIVNESPNAVICRAEYISLKRALFENFQFFRLDLNDIRLMYPFRPTFHSLINIQSRGCNRWIRLNKKAYGTPRGIGIREEKWANELGTNPGINFWNNSYKLTSKIFYSNKIKWLQYQIVRNCLKTNIIVSKFTQISPSCTFCQTVPESISHLFWDCNITKTFIENIRTLLYAAGVDFAFSKNSFLFGTTPGMSNSLCNLIANFMKLFIWISRCKNNICTSDNFIRWFNFEIDILKLAFLDNEVIQSVNFL